MFTARYSASSALYAVGEALGVERQVGHERAKRRRAREHGHRQLEVVGPGGCLVAAPRDRDELGEVARRRPRVLAAAAQNAAKCRRTAGAGSDASIASAAAQKSLRSRSLGTGAPA